MKILSGALLVVLALSVVLVASASAATVGGGTAATMPHPDEFSQLFAACLDTRDANSDECYRAQEASGLSPEEFFDKLMRKLDALAEQPKPEPKTPDAWALMKECAGTRDLESDACRRFIDATGLAGDEVARLADGLASPRGEQQATAETKSPATAVTETMQACADLRSEMIGEKSTEQLADLAEKINNVCPKAIRESKLSPGQFWSKVSAYR
ncbi:MAG: hypothetical protein E6I19_08495 [Chloroflexi bacterium]|nr:MAG: hypothetical protein E6I19_08495 [Chloroflexota bacterium]